MTVWRFEKAMDVFNRPYLSVSPRAIKHHRIKRRLRLLQHAMQYLVVVAIPISCRTEQLIQEYIYISQLHNTKCIYKPMGGETGGVKQKQIGEYKTSG